MDEYSIKIAGELDPSWSEWFDGLEVKIEGGNADQSASLLSGWITDQAHLRGVLNKIWDLNLKVISVRLVLSVDEDQ
jgi:hypothetical protein